MLRMKLLAAGIGAGLLCGSLGYAQTTAPAATPAAAGDHTHHFDPAAWHQKMCTERYPRMAGRLGYLEAKLKLTADQHSLFETWRTSVLDRAKASEQDCLAHQPADFTKAVPAPEREAQAEKRAEMHLASLKAIRPSMEALYKSLTPEQKAAFDEAGRGGHHHHWHDRPQHHMQ